MNSTIHLRENANPLQCLPEIRNRKKKKKHILTDPICTIINPVSETGKVQNHISHEQMQNTQQNISK